MLSKDFNEVWAAVTGSGCVCLGAMSWLICAAADLNGHCERKAKLADNSPDEIPRFIKVIYQYLLVMPNQYFIIISFYFCNTLVSCKDVCTLIVEKHQTNTSIQEKSGNSCIKSWINKIIKYCSKYISFYKKNYFSTPGGWLTDSGSASERAATCLLVVEVERTRFWTPKDLVKTLPNEVPLFAIVFGLYKSFQGKLNAYKFNLWPVIFFVLWHVLDKSKLQYNILIMWKNLSERKKLYFINTCTFILTQKLHTLFVKFPKMEVKKKPNGVPPCLVLMAQNSAIK